MNLLHIGGGRYRIDDEPIWPRPNRSILAWLVAAIFLVLFIAAAAAQEVAPAPDTSVNIGPLIGRLLKSVRPIIDTGILWGVGGIVGWVAIAYNRVLGRQLEEQHRKTLETAIANGVMLAADKVLAAVETKTDITVDVRYTWIAELIRPYVETSAPDALAALSVTDAKLDEKIEAKLNAVILSAKTGAPLALAPPAAASA